MWWPGVSIPLNSCPETPSRSSQSALPLGTPRFLSSWKPLFHFPVWLYDNLQTVRSAKFGPVFHCSKNSLSPPTTCYRFPWCDRHEVTQIPILKARKIDRISIQHRGVTVTYQGALLWHEPGTRGQMTHSDAESMAYFIQKPREGFFHSALFSTGILMF